jgi:hypothetical protein
MKIETGKQVPRRGQNGLLQALCGLKPGQYARLHTAAEARVAIGLSTIIRRKTGKTLHTRIEGDDLLVWLEQS